MLHPSPVYDHCTEMACNTDEGDCKEEEPQGDIFQPGFVFFEVDGEKAEEPCEDDRDEGKGREELMVLPYDTCFFNGSTGKEVTSTVCDYGCQDTQHFEVKSHGREAFYLFKDQARKIGKKTNQDDRDWEMDHHGVEVLKFEHIFRISNKCTKTVDNSEGVK